MLVSLALDSNNLDIVVDQVTDAEVSRMARIDIELLKALGSLTHFPVVGQRHLFQHERATLDDLRTVVKVLQGFSLVPAGGSIESGVVMMVEKAPSPPRKVILTIELTNCLDCQHHRKIRDPGSDDSFDASDETVVCMKTPSTSGPTAWWGKPYPGRIISACERWPNRQRKECEVPDWCPLLETT